MSVSHVIDSIFSGFQKSLEEEHVVRDVIRNVCKEMDQISREITTVLQVIHHNKAGISPACLRARQLFEKAKERYSKLKEVVPATDYYKYLDHWRFVTQRYCFLISLTIWLEKGNLATHDTVAAVLGISAVEQKVGFHLDIEDYLVGVLNMCSELSRFAVNAVTSGDYEKPLQISKFVMEVNAGFRLLNLKNDHLRKRFDALKYDVKKIEEVVYDLSIRGLLPKPEAQDAPVAPVAPVAPDASVAPAAAAAPVAPAATVAPAAPVAPDVPVAPNAPIAPDAPETQHAPETPQTDS